MRALATLAALLLASLVPGGCATAPPSEADPGERFLREVAPFPVQDEHGEPYDHPFLGGLLVPRVQFVDINGDGLLDLFLQERHGELIHFENVGTPREPRFVWRTDHFQELDIGEWFRFVDLDGDGRWDLMAEERFSHIRVFHNTGPADDPRFELIPDTLRDVEGTPIFADRQNIPSVTDIDCDGTLDLFLGRVDGTLTRYEEVDRETEHGLPRFRQVTDRFEGIEIVGRVGDPPPTLHGANSMAWHDLDGDGVQDLFWGDFFEPSLLIIENTGSCPNFSLRSPLRLTPTEGPPIATSGFNAPAFADLNGDGRRDLFIGVLGGAYNPSADAATNLHHYQRTEDRSFRLVTRRFLTAIDVGSESTVNFADLNGNGLLDMVVGSKMDPRDQATGRLFHYRNEGSASEPAFQLADTLTLAESYHYAPTFADLWDDDRPALVLGTWNDGVHFYRHTGEEGLDFETEPEFSVELTRGSHTVPALADLNGNGLLDLLVGKSNGQLSHFRNVGDPGAPRFELVTDSFHDIDVGRRSAPTFVDMDGDGQLELVVGSEDGELFLYRNLGTLEDPRWERDEGFQLRLHRNATPAFAEIFGDSVPHLFAGGISGGVQFYRRPPG